MHDGDDPTGRGKPYKAPALTQLDPHDVIRKLTHALTGPLGDTREQRLKNAASAIQNVLERLPAEERDDAIFEVVEAGGRWVRKCSWAP